MDPEAQRAEYGEEDEAEWRLAQRESEQTLLAVAVVRMLARSEKMAMVQGWVS